MSYKRTTEQIYREIINKVTEKLKEIYISEIEGSAEEIITLIKKVINN
jgi:hypothetical protein